MPIRYELVNEVAPEQVERLCSFMVERHLPDAWATGCFTEITFEQESPTRFRGVFTAEDRADLERYFAEHAPRLRDDAAEHMAGMPPPQRFEWEVVARWA